MIVVKDHVYYEKVVAEAKKRGCMEQLQEKLDYLANYACQEDSENTRCELYNDFAPLSFSFVMYRKEVDGEYERRFNGGLIFHPGATGPDKSLSVELNPSDKPHWSVHT